MSQEETSTESLGQGPEGALEAFKAAAEGRPDDEAGSDGLEQEAVREEQPVEQEAKAEAEPSPEPEKGESLSRLIKKERELQKKAEELKALEEKLASMEKTEPQQAPPSVDRLKRLALTNPYEALAQLGLTPEQISEKTRVLVAHDLGDDAPEDFKALLNKSARDMEIDAIREELQALRAKDEERQQALARAEEERKANEHRASYKKELFSAAEASSGLVKNMWYNNKERAQEALYGVAVRLARENQSKGIEDAPTHEQVIKALEKELSELASLLKPIGTGASNTLNSNLDGVSRHAASEPHGDDLEGALRAYREATSKQR